jgi:hypothetical protein
VITAVAIIQNGVCYVGIPNVERHHHLIHYIAKKVGIRPVNGEQGFIDDMGIFHTRESAGKHAVACGQVQVGKANFQHAYDGRRLYSEDVW